MNIFISPFAGEGFYYRPDSTMIRHLDEYYVPDFVTRLFMTPFQYVRIGKPVKYIDPKYVHRYLDAFGYGLLLVPEIEGTHDPFLLNALDFSTLVPLEHIGLQDNYGTVKKDLVLLKNDEKVLQDIHFVEAERLYEKIASMSRYGSIKIGDFVAFELSGPIPLSSGDKIGLQSFDTELLRLFIR